jgi:hypothetical protein
MPPASSASIEAGIRDVPDVELARRNCGNALSVLGLGEFYVGTTRASNMSREFAGIVDFCTADPDAPRPRVHPF